MVKKEDYIKHLEAKVDKNRKEASEFSVEISETVTKAAVREATEQLISINMIYL